MAIIVRLTFEEMRDSVLRRMGRKAASPQTKTDVEYLVAAAYKHLALTFHHHELEVFDSTVVLTATSNTKAIPTDLYATISLSLRNPGGVWKKHVKYAHLREVQARFSDSSGAPSFFSRSGSDFVFDLKADVAYEVDLRYYKRPAGPDFSSGSSLLDPLWDEYVMQCALWFGWPTQFRFDMAGIQAQMLSQVVAETIQPRLGVEPIRAVPEMALTDRSAGGGQ